MAAGDELTPADLDALLVDSRGGRVSGLEVRRAEPISPEHQERALLDGGGLVCGTWPSSPACNGSGTSARPPWGRSGTSGGGRGWCGRPA